MTFRPPSFELQLFRECNRVDQHLQSMQGYMTVASIDSVLPKLIGRHYVDLQVRRQSPVLGSPGP